MQNFGQAFANYINSTELPESYYTPEVAPVDFSEYENIYETPEQIQARTADWQARTGFNNTYGTSAPSTAPINISDYSRYGVNYDVDGDGRVGLFEGMSLGGLWNNIISGGKELGTGFTYLGTHPKEVGQMAYNYLGEVGAKSGGNLLKNLGYITTDITDAILTPYGLDSATRNEVIGDVAGSLLAGDISGAVKYAQSGLSKMTHRIYEHPADVIIDATTLGAGKALSGLSKGGKAATKAQSVLSTETANVARGTEKIISSGEKVVKEAKNSDELARAVEAAEQTGDWSAISPKTKKNLKEYSQVVDDTMAKYSPATHVDAEKLSIIQKYARDNNLTYQEAERIITPVLDEAEKGVAITVRYTPNEGLANDVRSIATIEELPLEQPRPEQILRAETRAIDQSPEVLEGMRKVFTVDELDKIKDFTGEEVYNFAKQTRNWTDRQLSDNFYNAGIRGIDGKINKAFNAKRTGKFDTETRDITLDPTADTGAVLHEWAHKELYDAREAAKLGDELAINEIDEFKRVNNLAPETNVTNKMLEDFSDEVSHFARTGELPEGELGEYIGRKYGIRQESVNKAAKLEHLDRLAEQGDDIARQVATSKRLFDKGDIFPITHGLAEVDRTASVDDIGRMMAGRFSTRAFGNAPYEAIAKEIANPNDYINQITKDYLDESVRNVLRNGGTADIDIRPLTPDSAMYISREALEDSSKSLGRTLDSATKSPVSPDDISIDRDFLRALKDQYMYQQTNNPFGRTPMGDLYNLIKSTALASGGYLVGNLQTGLANAVINSNAGLIDDVINATLTKGKLAKQLGLFRREGIRNANITKVGRALQELNLRTGGYLLSKADAKIQNMFAEIAAHSKLRRQGIPSAQRVAAVSEIEGQRLGDFINDVKLVSLINPTKTITPAWARGFAGIFNPFWRWIDTAAQSSLYMLKNHPVLANAVLLDVLAKAGYDKEMQNRLGIGVELDKPFVSYKVNPKTGQPREMSMEFLPQMNTLKFSSEVMDAMKGKGDLESLTVGSLPFFGTALLAMRGLNKYGKPMYRDHKSMYDSVSVVGGKRYKLNPETGLPEPYGGQLDEVISAVANETIGSLSLINRTLAPSAAWAASKVTGKDYDYYLPHGQYLFGAFGERGKAPTERIPFLIGGDPTRPRGDQEISNMLRGIYETNYFPSSRLEQGIYNPSLLRNFYKGLNRRNMRESEILMNR